MALFLPNLFTLQPPNPKWLSVESLPMPRSRFTLHVILALRRARLAHLYRLQRRVRGGARRLQELLSEADIQVFQPLPELPGMN
jgi:hypothetical protein